MATLSAVQIKQGTTPIITADVDGVDIREATVYLSISTGKGLIVKTNYYDSGDVSLTPIYDDEDNVSGTSVETQLSQLESLCLRPGLSRIEIGWIFEDGSADRTNTGILKITPTIYRRVMEYGKHSS